MRSKAEVLQVSFEVIDIRWLNQKLRNTKVTSHILISYLVLKLSLHSLLSSLWHV